MIKSQYLRRFGIVTFYYDRPFTVSLYPDDGIDLFPDNSDCAHPQEVVNEKNN